MESDMSDFTDGNWEVREQTKSQGVEVVCVKNDEYRRTKRVAFAKGVRNKNHANAHLISAAPDMYRALREIVSNSSIQANFPHECEVAEAALAKADGEMK